jgi:hypothetical protein
LRTRGKRRRPPTQTVLKLAILLILWPGSLLDLFNDRTDLTRSFTITRPVYVTIEAKLGDKLLFNVGTSFLNLLKAVGGLGGSGRLLVCISLDVLGRCCGEPQNVHLWMGRL